MMQKHPLWLRLSHWINVPVLALLVWSGVLIYWANGVYPGFFPEWFYSTFGLSSRLAEGMGVHFLLAWIFVLNGLFYVTGFVISGHWREVIPQWRTWGEVGPVILHDLGLRETAPAQGKYNAAQRIAYTSAVLLGILAVASGFAIYKPVQLGWLRALFFGYEGARLVHFVAMISLVGFTFMHVVQVLRAGWNNFLSMVAGDEHTGRKRTAWSLAGLAIFFAIFATLFTLARNAPDADGTPAPFREAFEWNGKVWGKLYSPSRSAACSSKPRDIRENGDVGLEDEVNLATWQLSVSEQGKPVANLRLDDIRKLPRTEAQIEFRCIEGWSTPISYAGARFSDFLHARGIDPSAWRYVGLATPDGAYYVSVDMESMLHPETVLAYEMNGKTLTQEHGAPLRLVIPVKYGIKSLKRIGKIFFSNERPPDYWAEQGYDWHSGL
jgi:thiosulfate reductase cytochrome b subunit